MAEQVAKKGKIFADFISMKSCNLATEKLCFAKRKQF
jgi:hypothetical protein